MWGSLLVGATLLASGAAPSELQRFSLIHPADAFVPSPSPVQSYAAFTEWRSAQLLVAATHLWLLVVMVRCVFGSPLPSPCEEWDLRVSVTVTAAVFVGVLMGAFGIAEPGPFGDVVETYAEVIPRYVGAWRMWPDALGIAVAAPVVVVAAQLSWFTGPVGARAVANRLRSARALLYASCIALLSGLLAVRAEMKWAFSYIWFDTAESRQLFWAAADDVVSATVVRHGVIFTVAIAAIFIPLILALNSEAEHLADKALGDTTLKQRKEWLEERGLTQGGRHTLAQAVATIAPALTGVLAQFAKGFAASPS